MMNTKSASKKNKTQTSAKRTSSASTPTASTGSVSFAAENENMNIDVSGNNDAQIDEENNESSTDNSQFKEMTKQATLMDILDKSSSYDEGGLRHNDITQALIYMICNDNMPLSCVEKPGLQRLIRVLCPRYKLPSRAKVTQLVEQRYGTTKAIIKKKLNETSNISMTSDILTLTNSTRSFIVVTAHFLSIRDNSIPELENMTLTAQRMDQAHTADYIKEFFEEITEDFGIEKNRIKSMTTDGGANMVAALRQFLGDGKRIPCMAHLLNLRRKKENAPDMIASSQLNVIRDIISLLSPFKQATEDISGDQYISASIAIPISHLLRKELEQGTPSTEVGIAVQKSLLDGVLAKLEPLERNLFLAKATILDPRFKRIHFNSALAVSNAISELSTEIRLEQRRRGQVSPECRSATTAESNDYPSTSIWSRHEKIMAASSSSSAEAALTIGGMPNELKQYLDQPLIPRKDNPLKFWSDCRHFSPVLSEIALKCLVPPASSVSSERVAYAVNLTVPNNRSRLTADHIKTRVFLLSVSNKYWFG